MDPPVSRREAAVAGLLGLALAVLMSWPLVLHLGRDVSENLQDPLLSAWQVAWSGQALLNQPLDLFQANAFWPLEDSLAFTDVLLGYAPAGLVGSGPGAAVSRYNILHLLAYGLNFLGTYLLARELGARPAGAGVAGLAFAYAPWRLAQNAHLHVLSSGGIPLSLFLLVRGYRRRSIRTVVAGWLVATWQLSLGFTLGLQLVYLLAGLAGVWLVSSLRAGRRPRPSRGLALATALGAGCLLVWGGLQARPFLSVAEEHPEARRTLAEVGRYSPPPAGLLAAPVNSRVWGGVTERILDGPPATTEDTLFPGATLLALAVLGLSAGAYPRRLRAGLAMTAVLFAILALGLGLGAWSPYRLLYELGPGWQGIRAPGRLITLTLLALALLAASGVHRLVSALDERRAAAGRVAALLLAALVLLEGWGRLDQPTVPRAPAGSPAEGPQLHLPSSPVTDPLYLLWSTEHFPPLLNGYAGFEPSSLRALRKGILRFPDRGSLDLLRAAGARTVIVHPNLSLAELAKGTPQERVYADRSSTADGRWRRAAVRSTAGLPVKRTVQDGSVVFTVDGVPHRRVRGARSPTATRRHPPAPGGR